MPIAIETVIIVIVIVSIAVLSAVLFALYWLWRLLLEDRRCSRLDRSSFPRDWPGPLASSGDYEPQRALLASRATHPRIAHRREMFVDERSRRRPKSLRCAGCQATPPAAPAPPAQDDSITRTESIHPTNVVVLDDTEPPPPYEAITS